MTDYTGLEEPTAEKATDRVAASPELSQYKDILTEDDWDNQEEHDKWVAAAPIQEIADWAFNITIDEEDQAAQEENVTVDSSWAKRNDTTLGKQYGASANLAAHKKGGGA